MEKKNGKKKGDKDWNNATEFFSTLVVSMVISPLLRIVDEIKIQGGPKKVYTCMLQT